MKKQLNVLQNISGQQELKPITILNSYYKYLKNNPKSVIVNFRKLLHYYDEPSFYSYHAELNINQQNNNEKLFGFSGEGYSFRSDRLAILKCLTEAFERYSNHHPRKRVRFERLNKITYRLLDPKLITAYSEEQKKRFSKFRISEKAMFGWVKGWNLTENYEVWIPAQLAYLDYKRVKNEPILLLPISTGAAASTTLAGSLYRGICEIIERDAFMITYLNKLPGTVIELSSHSRLSYYDRIAQRYRLNLRVIDISANLGVYTFLSVVVDTTGIGIAVSTGLGAGLDPIEAMCHAIEESFHPRSWIRSEMEKMGGAKKITAKDIKDIVSRGLYWASTERIRDVEFFFSDDNKYSAEDYQDQTENTTGKTFLKLLQLLRDKNISVYYTDITSPEAEQIGIVVVKVIIPELQPLYLHEGFPCFGGKRLYNLPVEMGLRSGKLREDELNKVPHPFL